LFLVPRFGHGLERHGRIRGQQAQLGPLAKFQRRVESIL
jgi:hypothetical protein